MATLEMFVCVGKFTWRSALEGKDRLLLVANGKNTAWACAAGAFAGSEFGDQLLDDRPLLRARVLRLIDQHMIDAEIKLVVHPRGIDAFHESERLVDQIVVIQEPSMLLLAAITADHRVGDGQQGDGAVPRRDGM